MIMKRYKIILFAMGINMVTVSLIHSQNFGYENPVITGMNPDPSVCRVGEDYYAVTSTFTWFPGVPVYHSKDLIHWKMIGYCLDRQSNLDLSKGSGIYAPTIRYNEGTFYMVTTNQRNRGNFYVTATDPSGTWSDPVWVEELAGIDPSLFFDDDGKVYFTTTHVNGIIQAEIDIQTGKLITVPKIIWQGTGGRYPEAPHLYKINGIYYLMISEGGTEYGHDVVVARSNNPWGPFESNPNNPILTHVYKISQSNPVQGTGHADLVQAQDGSWWMLFLAFRPVGRHHHIGRETFLAPVKWTARGWPLVNTTGTVDLKMNVPTLPQVPVQKEAGRENFDTQSLPLRWNYIGNPDTSAYSLTERKGWLTLKAGEKNFQNPRGMTFTGFRQKDLSFTTTVSMDFRSTGDNDEAGISVFHRETGHYDVYLTENEKKNCVVLRYVLGNMAHEEAKIQISSSEAYLRVEGTPTMYTFSFSEDGKEYNKLGSMDARFLSSETLGGFTGVFIGLYATSNGKKSTSKAFFDWIEYNEIK